METYFIFEKGSPQRLARIHKDECPSCFFGRGTQKNVKHISCKWHGPYETLAKAEEKARSFPDRTLFYCKICLPELSDAP